ncbi:MAG: hypothetical protein KME17_30620 [Cyanosarcina radialis HA8281-LM2]|nr:hypothetical protein [Cyanosarcina radialis HA8281-LM2]
MGRWGDGEMGRWGDGEMGGGEKGNVDNNLCPMPYALCPMPYALPTQRVTETNSSPSASEI